MCIPSKIKKATNFNLILKTHVQLAWSRDYGIFNIMHNNDIHLHE